MNKDTNSDDLISCPRPISNHDTIQLSHGSGGKLTNDLISNLFVRAFDNPILRKLDDQATLEIDGVRLAFSTDSYVVDPIFFPGGDIGELAVNGTVNDLSMCGARPLHLSAGFIVEEGLPMADLEKIVASMKRAATAARVQIVTGDTKVVNKGKGDKLFVNTTGIGVIEHDFHISSDNLQPGDIIIISGTVADHGMAILSKREGLSFEAPIDSDTAPLNSLVENIIRVAGAGVHAMRDPTRGGVAATLNEFVQSSEVGIHILEKSIPINPPVGAACELLGFDPLYVANEGKLVAVIAEDVSEAALRAMKAHPLGHRATVIGRVSDKRPGMVTLETRIGGLRIVDMPVGEQLPRIC